MIGAMPDPAKISFGEMRESGIRGLLVYCAGYRCSHSVAISGDGWPDDSLSDMEARFVCQACGKCGADVRPDFNWNKPSGRWGTADIKQKHRTMPGLSMLSQEGDQYLPMPGPVQLKR
jgi:hypothetical protein